MCYRSDCCKPAASSTRKVNRNMYKDCFAPRGFCTLNFMTRAEYGTADSRDTRIE